MTTKERLHKLVDELSEAEAQNARIVVEDAHDAVDELSEAEAQNARIVVEDAHDAVAEQADLEAMLDEEADELLEEMDAEERRAGVQPWQA